MKQATYLLGLLPRDMREEMFNLHSTSVDPEVTERAFARMRVPTGMLNIAGIFVGTFSAQQLARYRVSDFNVFPPIVIAGGKLIDGGHRIAVAQQVGVTQLRYIDLTGLLDPESTGYITDLGVNNPPRIAGVPTRVAPLVSVPHQTPRGVMASKNQKKREKDLSHAKGVTIGALPPPPLDGDIDAIRRYLSDPNADRDYIRRAAETLNLSLYQATAAVMVRNPNTPVDILLYADLVWGHPEAFLENPALALHLLENPNVFAHALKEMLLENDDTSLPYVRAFGWKAKLDYQQGMRDLFMGPEIGRLGAFTAVPAEDVERYGMPPELSMTTRGFMILHFDRRDFICVDAFHAWSAWESATDRWLEGNDDITVTLLSYAQSATEKQGDWQAIVDAIAAEEEVD